MNEGLPPPKTDREVWGDKIADEAKEQARKIGYPPQGTYRISYRPVPPPRELTPEEQQMLSERVMDTIQGHLWCLSNEEWSELRRREDERRS